MPPGDNFAIPRYWKRMFKRCEVLIVGGAVLTRTGSETWATKTPFADYLNELAQRFGRCTWVAHRSPGIQFAGRIDTERVDVIVLGRSAVALALTWWRLTLLMLQRPAVILYLPGALPLLPVVPVIRALAARLVVYLAGDYEMTLRERGREPWPGWRRLFRSGFEYPLASADVVLARGRHLAGLARRMNRRVVETVPIGHMNLRAADLTVQEKRPIRSRLLFVGKVLWSKGIGDLLLAIESLRRARPELPLTLSVVGDGTDRGAAERRVSELGLDDTVTFHGWIDDPARFAELLENGDLVVVPSSTHPEGVPRVIDEALARGLPVIATRVGGIEAEFEPEEVLLVAPGAPGELAQAIERVVCDQLLYEQLVRGGRRRRQRWAAAGSVARQHAEILVKDLGTAGGLSDVFEAAKRLGA
jgi:glycosyltransferase involved in cell wall biosynthesis